MNQAALVALATARAHEAEARSKAEQAAAYRAYADAALLDLSRVDRHEVAAELLEHARAFDAFASSYLQMAESCRQRATQYETLTVAAA